MPAASRRSGSPERTTLAIIFIPSIFGSVSTCITTVVGLELAALVLFGVSFAVRLGRSGRLSVSRRELTNPFATVVDTDITAA